ncbi:hypothetical protein [Mycobacteroides franklinii]|uniref:hypothetical protein n=1 Tax=Mycobacteroides franklinii TaxID=948102 RepID=UPI0013E8DAD2
MRDLSLEQLGPSGWGVEVCGNREHWVCPTLSRLERLDITGRLAQDLMPRRG